MSIPSQTSLERDGGTAVGENQKPDIFWIVTDEHRRDAIGSYGNDWIHTPNLDRLADRGVLFENAFCQVPACVPSRASFLSGRYGSTIGALWFDRVRDDVPFFPEYLRGAGYVTVNVGKEHHFRDTSPFDLKLITNGYCKTPAGKPHRQQAVVPLEPSILDEPENERFMAEASCTELSSPYDGMEDELGILCRYTSPPHKQHILAGTNPLPPEEAETGLVVNRALRFLTDYTADAPMIMELSLTYPHSPVLPPVPFDTMFDPDDMVFPGDEAEETGPRPFDFRMGYEQVEGMTSDEIRRIRASYYGLCSYVDDQIGRFLDYLADNWSRPYVVIFHSDHGNLLGEHGLTEKFNMFDPSIRVPLIISGTGVPRGMRIEALTELIDIAPTVLELAGVPLRDEMALQGRSLLDLMHDPHRPWRDAAFVEASWMNLDGPIRNASLFKDVIVTEIAGRRGHDLEQVARFIEDENRMPGLTTFADYLDETPYRYWRPIFRTIRTSQFVMTVRAVWLDGQGDELMGSLYDLSKDTWELHNVFDDPEYRTAREDLFRRIQAWSPEVPREVKSRE